MTHRLSFAGLLLALGLAQAAGAADVKALVRTPAGQPVADAAVVLEPLASAPARGHARATIEQHDSEFVPYVTIVQAGTAIDFPNHDTTRHHVYSFSPPKQFELKLYKGKPSRPVVFDRPGEVVLGCNIHDWMEAYVLVVASPYFAKTGADGNAMIANVPAGRYRLRLWHPLRKSDPPPREIDVGVAPTRLSLAIDVKPRLAKPHDMADQDSY
jgi:plastocyanin